MSGEISAPLGFAIIAIVIFFVWQIYGRKIKRINQMPEIPRVIPANGFKVPVLATFKGLKRLPRQVSFAYNNLNPYLNFLVNRGVPLSSRAKAFLAMNST